MIAHSSLDRESFQLFLANAFAVQESGLDTQSLSAVIEMQRFIDSDGFDLGHAMHMTADRALKVSNASGVAIALLEGNELVYCAGSGTAANDVGHHIRAVVNVGSGSELRREILRVENAQIDSRVQAEVCRQFGANSLLMLPIYEREVLVGVLQVLYGEAHSFLDSEVRAYRLMSGVVGEAITRHSQHAEKKAARRSFEQVTYDNSVSQNVQSAENVAQTWAVVADAIEQNVSQGQSSRGEADYSIRESRAQRTRLTTAIRKNANRGWNSNFWRLGAVVTASAVLAIASWITYSDHSVRGTIRGAVPRRDDARQHAPAKPFSLNDNSNRVVGGAQKTRPSSAGFRRIGIGPHEVDYIAEDVTIRNFTTGPAQRLARTAEKQVNFGDDVTVRYFAYTPPAVSQTPPALAASQSTKHPISTSH
jgi:hypothetical protein